MKKFSIILLFILGFFVVFALSAVITFSLTLDRDEKATEPATETMQTVVPDTQMPVDTDIEAEVAVTRVTPSLSVADAIIVKTVYGAPIEEAESDYEMPEAVVADDVREDIIENEVVEAKADTPKTETKKEEVKTESPKTETKKEEVKAEAPKAETKVEAKKEEPKTETKKEEVKAEVPKTETKKEEVKVEEPKAEEKKEEVKVEEPAVEEKVETPVVEEKPVVLDPNKQYSDTGI